MSFANTADLGQAATQWQKMMMDSWGQWTKSTVSSDSFATASGAYMDWALSTQKVVTEVSGQILETMDMPRRSDMARLSAQVQAVETRLLDQEDNASEIRDLLVALNAKLDKLSSEKPAATAPVSAAAVSAPSVSAAPAPVAKAVAAETVREAVKEAVSEVKVVKAPRAKKGSTKKGKG